MTIKIVNKLSLLTVQMDTVVTSTLVKMMCYSVMTQLGILGKRNSEFSQQESNLRPSDY